MTPPLRGLVLAGGRSSRMGVDKGALVYSPTGESQRLVCARLLGEHCRDVFVSCREAQRASLEPSLRPLVDDTRLGDHGPVTGLLTAYRANPGSAWLVLAVDFPAVDGAGLAQLVEARLPGALATAFVNGEGVVEPLFCLWEPAGLEALLQAPGRGARRVLEAGPTQRVVPHSLALLRNVNTPDERG